MGKLGGSYSSSCGRQSYPIFPKQSALPTLIVGLSGNTLHILLLACPHNATSLESSLDSHNLKYYDSCGVVSHFKREYPNSRITSSLG